MPDFNAIKAQVNESREALNSEKKKVFLAREKIQRVKRIKGQILRSKGKNSEQYRILEENERDLKQSLASRKQRLSGLLQNHSGLYEAFGQFTDPRQNLEQFSNEYPILLFPLRLETRFKKITENGVVKHQLWVRVFPDECSVDTFDDVPSEAEIIKVQNYWIDLWKTGVASAPDLQPFVINKNKGAWKALMGNHNPGRAYWLTQIYGPLNESDIPTRMNESDLIWIIAAENPPTSANQSAIITYWRSFFAAAGDPTKLQTAFDALKTTLAADDATTASVIREFTPVNISDPPADEAGEVIVAFLNFPPAEDVDAKLNSWSGAARVTTLPERLVLIGLEKDNPTPVINQLGNPIPDPLIVGPDPGEDIDEVLKTVHGDSFEDLPDEEKASKYMEYLSAQSETSWLFDFEEAINIGLGFKVDLQEHQYENGLQKLYVLGVRLSADENEAQKLLENLLKNHHFGDTGFSILPQGTPTNNTEDSASSYSEREDADEAFDRYFSTTPPEDPSDDALKCDGKWLAELLGISTIDSTLKLSEYYYHKDQCESRAMNTALWNATLGYFMESMLTPVFDDDQIEFTRWFLINHVSGRGRIPAIRIGDQPYGILPVSTVSSLPWMKDRNSSFAEIYSHQFPFFQKLSVLLSKIRETWDDLLEAVAYVGKNGEDGHQIILQALGLHASSVEFDQRYAESFEQLYNTSILTGINPGSLSVWTEIFYKLGGILLLQQLGYAHDFEANPQIPILEKFFFTKENDVNRPLIDDQPLSEEKKIRAYTDPGENYIEWLIEQALKDHRNLKDQKGFTDDKAPNALLYGMLRHALNLEYSNSGLRLYQQAGIMNAASVSEARIDAPFIGISSEPQAFESKWDYLYRREPQISHSNDLLVDHITEKLKAAVPTAGLEHLNELIDALDHLKDRPTASLERAFVEHLDCCTYRLDAWLLGLVNLQLYHMRYGTTEAPKQGIYLGAYGWVEDLKPDHKQFEPVEFTDDELRNTFNPDGTLTINRDDTNYGYIHAPSISHAQTASVLRNAYKSTASEENAEIYKINLSSERVRLALSMVEGLQQGQSLGALLGYQLERGLHDNTNLELDVFIYELRKIFPLRSNRQQGTQISEDRVTENDDESTRYPEEEAEFEEENAVTKIEARNVVDGLALLEHIKTNGQENYPFGIPVGKGPGKLMAAPGPEGDAIDAEVQRLMNIRDAVADLAMAESVHQVVQGNYERASGALDTYSKGNYPQTPDVIQSPGSGITLNHRFGI
ncbi:MAG: hypothetical protein OER04_11460, partial [Cyclobacteriaceae bacterium]|nr:hypothetical protein [Cyclobacteriaceae bacterium]